ncbi:MAG TPA: OmpH family outer membrane protein, partial [Nitrospirota bacterium]|nr:OmpH family outer membrane protein [Nitrospirota bacterium]
EHEEGDIMKKHIALVAVLVLALFATNVMAAGGKMAYIDTQTVFDKTKLGKKYQGVVREYYESRKKILDLDADEIQKLQDEYAKQKQGKLLNEKAQKEKEETLNRKINEFQKKREEFSGEIGKKNEELSNEFNQQMIAIVREIAKKEKVSLVLNKTINILSKAEVPSVLYGDEDLDLTEKVIAEMDKKEEPKAEPKPKP